MNEIAINIEGLNVNFGDHIALQDINIKIEEAAFLAIVGPNGSGKTTFLKSLMGIQKPSSGKIEIFGKDSFSSPSESIGYVPQIKTMDRYFPALAIDLVASGLRKAWPGKIKSYEKEKIMHALEQIGAGNLAKRPLNSLSGGELQRIYLARGIVKKPKILLLDEPTTGIDMVCETNINSIIDDYNREYKTTVVMVTHNWATAQHHAKYALILNTRQYAFGESKEILTSENLLQAFNHIDLANHSHGAAHA
jgi:zinc transport system ATP-binding protein